jgi:hypothetical protein
VTAQGIKRLRGEGAELVWPKKVILPLVKLVERKRAAFVGSGDRNRYRSASSDRAFFEEYRAARKAAARAFAAAQGWRRGPLTHRFYTLLPPGHELRKKRWGPLEGSGFWDHPETYYGNGLSIAVVHLYGPLNIADVPAGLIIDELPASWYSPETTAYVYRPERLYSGAVTLNRNETDDEK